MQKLACSHRASHLQQLGCRPFASHKLGQRRGAVGFWFANWVSYGVNPPSPLSQRGAALGGRPHIQSADHDLR